MMWMAAILWIFSALGWVLSCRLVLSWIEQRRRRAMLAIVPPHYVGKSPILDGHVMVSIEGSRVTLVFAEEVSKDRDYVEQSVEITKWQARRLLLQLSHKLDFSVPVETYDRIHNDRV